MAVRKKGRRKIVRDGKNYVWFVNLDYESPLMLLHICAEDKSMVLVYPIGSNYIVSEGKMFQGVQSNHWRRYFLPFESTECVTPGFVAKIIDWANGGSDANYLDDIKSVTYTNVYERHEDGSVHPLRYIY
ncbi:MAG: hypothetical protein II931_04775 [Clostridia bacterium]|nr:hypothetical protein [Clostridia bacterium]